MKLQLTTRICSMATICILTGIFLIACVQSASQTEKNTQVEYVASELRDSSIRNSNAATNTDNKKPTVEELMQFAESLQGIPYRYGSSDPAVGFDCSGFITHVFNHFDITVPRSSIGFINLGIELKEAESKRGDIILFTGTNPKETFVGHMGLIVSNDSQGLSFIHSTSGKAKSVTITPLNEYYRNRLVGFRRITW